uniref:Uncharacterized protein n=1 Tax=Vitis vinifera TaxID=29760 RepID=F6GU31_VITVI
MRKMLRWNCFEDLLSYERLFKLH